MGIFTGERIHPNIPALTFTYIRHLVVYQRAASFAQGKKVLDCGSGEGYGSALLAQSANTVLGLDYSRQAIATAKKTYHASNLIFSQSNFDHALPLPSNSIDLVTCFQVIEHLKHPKQFLEEVQRVLTQDGLLIISTPNCTTFSPTGDILDPFHWREYDRHSFTQLLGLTFPSITVYPLTGNASVLNQLNRDISFSKTLVKFDPLRLRSWLPRPLRKIGYGLGLNIARRFQHPSNQTQRLTMDDFRLSDQHEPENVVLDYVAFCSQDAQRR